MNRHLCVLFFFFYQIYVELEKLHHKYTELELKVKDNCQVSKEICESEESLHHRIYVLEQNLLKQSCELNAYEEEVQYLREQNHELKYTHNVMVTKLNDVILELNDVITVLNNKSVKN